MKMRKQFFLIACTVGSVALFGAEQTGEELMVRTDVTSQEKSVESLDSRSAAEALVKQANQAYADAKYDDATKLYLGAIGNFQKAQAEVENFSSDEYTKRIEFCRNQIARTYQKMADSAVAEAERLFEAKKYDDAIAALKNAAKYAPEKADSINKLIAQYEKRQKYVQSRSETSEATLLPEKENQAYRIRVLMKQGEELAKAKKYDEALRKFQDVMLIDPFNSAAIQNANAMAARMKAVLEVRVGLEHRHTMAEQEWIWVTPISSATVATNVIDEATVKDETTFTELQEKLMTVKIPKMDLFDVTIPTAIRYLQEESKRNDPKGVGINIFLMRDPAAATKPTNDSPATNATVGAAVVGGATVENEGPVFTLLLQDVTILEALGRICTAAKMRYRVERYAVVIAPENVIIDEMETRLFPVEPSVLASIPGRGDNPADLQKYFEDLGILFPAGSKIIFDRRISRLIATNTLDNLVALESQIEKVLTVQEPLVEIVTKFLEVSENDLKELGFNYSWGYDVANAVIDPNTGNPTNGQDQYGNYKPAPLDTTHKIGSKMSDSTINTSFTENSLMLFNMQNNGGFQVSAAVNAANQADSKDILSAPRVVTLQNQDVYIEMVLKTYFADSYTTGSNTTSTGGVGSTMTSIGPMPQFADETNLGIQLRLRPVADLKRRIININNFSPLISSFVGFMNFDYEDSSGQPALIRKPIIDVREINSSLSIYDGGTVVIGGVVNDDIQTIDDKYPILGDLPVVGRLFQSKGTLANRRNLLIFITCRLVKPDGTAFFPATANNSITPNLGSSYRN